MPWSHGSFHWNERLTRDVERAKKFYSQTIGWTFDAMAMEHGGTYWVAMMDGKPELPVCEYHQKRRLWWHKGWIFDRDEEAE